MFRDDNLDKGWMVGDGGVVLRSLIGAEGQVWTDANPVSRIVDRRDFPEPCGQNKGQLRDIFMISDQVGWIVGEDGVVEKTTNGWLSSVSMVDQVIGTPCDPNPRDFYRVHFFEDSSPDDPYDHGIIASEFKFIYVTNDGGATWTEIDVPNDAGSVCPPTSGNHNLEFWDLEFEDPGSSSSPGWLVGGAGNTNGYTFYTSAGGGVGTWSQSLCYEFLNPFDALGIDGQTTQYALAILGTAEPQAIVAGYAEEIFTLESGTANFDRCIPAVSQPASCASGGPTWVQKDGAPTYPDPCGNRPPLYSIARVDASTACVGGSFGRIMRYDAITDDLTDVASDDFTRLNAGVFTTATEGWAFGQGRVIKKSTDAGVTWSDATVDWTCDLGVFGHAIAFSETGKFGLVVGSAGFIGRTSDFGVTWQELTVPAVPSSLPDLHDVVFTSGTTALPGGGTIEHAYIVGADATVLKSTDQGATWTTLTTGTTTSTLHGVDFASSATGYVVGTDGTVLSTNNGGFTWTSMAVNAQGSETYYDVATWNYGTQAIIVGQNGNVYEKTSTASRFLRDDHGLTTETLFDVELVEDGTTDPPIRISGVGGAVLFRDVGVWSRPWPFSNGPIPQLSFTSANEGFAFGRNFVILRYDF